jgi:NAD(P)H-dependent flavin oxidoreductase YrpB (nitropropane dioxygenase family)
LLQWTSCLVEGSLLRAQAREAMEAAADVIVAQGTEAGGHGQSEPLVTLLPLVVSACPNIRWSPLAGLLMDAALPSP